MEHFHKPRSVSGNETYPSVLFYPHKGRDVCGEVPEPGVWGVARWGAGPGTLSSLSVFEKTLGISSSFFFASINSSTLFS